MFARRISLVKTSVSQRRVSFGPSSSDSVVPGAWPSVTRQQGTGPMVIGDLMTRTLEPSTSGTRSGRLAQALGMMSEAMHEMSRLEADVSVDVASVQMVANLVEEDEDEEHEEDEESVFEGDRHH